MRATARIVVNPLSSRTFRSCGTSYNHPYYPIRRISCTAMSQFYRRCFSKPGPSRARLIAAMARSISHPDMAMPSGLYSASLCCRYSRNTGISHIASFARFCIFCKLLQVLQARSAKVGHSIANEGTHMDALVPRFSTLLASRPLRQRRPARRFRRAPGRTAAEAFRPRAQCCRAYAARESRPGPR